ncbi:ROK family protein [Tessaracoccus sp. HDW20]|nr:ROK family protein [Tessaracoccus coleopterorum]
MGGTHVAAAMVDPVAGTVVGRQRERLDSSGSLAGILAGMTEMAGRMSVPRPVTWGVAIPGPFHYDTGVGDFAGADKFGALEGSTSGPSSPRGCRASRAADSSTTPPRSGWGRRATAPRTTRSGCSS